jgi:hypothetical protein
VRRRFWSLADSKSFGTGYPPPSRGATNTAERLILHLVDTTADGGGDQVLLDGTTWHYAPPVSGSIKGETTTCASPEDPLLMHQDYEPRPVDFHDVRRIAERLGLPLPVGFDAQERK